MIHTDKILPQFVNNIHKIRLSHSDNVHKYHTNEVIIVVMVKFPFTLNISTGCCFDKILCFFETSIYPHLHQYLAKEKQ